MAWSLVVSRHMVPSSTHNKRLEGEQWSLLGLGAGRLESLEAYGMEFVWNV